MPQSLFDKDQFLKSLANDEELAGELLAAFLEDSPVRRDSLGEALEANDAVAASKLAHSLKGMCGVVRAQALVDAALTMEHNAKTGNLDKVREQYAAFVELMEQAHQEMANFPA